MFYSQTSEEITLSSLLECEDTRVEYSSYKEEYIRELGEIVVDLEACEDRILRSGIVYHNNSERFVAPKAKVRRVERGGAVITYLVEVGKFSVEVRMLNLPLQAEPSRTILSMGTFGVIVKAGSGLVAKRLLFQNKQKVLNESDDLIHWEMQMSFVELQALLIEYAYNRICSVLQIGPQVRLQHNFDVVCYTNSAQFYLEKCYPCEHLPLIQHRARILYCMKVMHAFQLIHKDIKPSNIAYSRLTGNLVLIDYGITIPVREQIGQKTLTHREGTPRFMSSQMNSAEAGVQLYVDLYWNDLQAALKSIDEIYMTKSDKRCDPFIQQAMEKDHPEDSLIMSLYALAVEDMPFKIPPSYFEGKLSKLIRSIADSGFPELHPSYSPEPDSSIVVKQNAEYLIRSMGPSGQLLQYLEMDPLPTYKIDRLANKIRSGDLFTSKQIYIKEFIQKKSMKIFDQLLKWLEAVSKPGVERISNKETVAILLSMTDCYITLGLHLESNSKKKLRKSIELRKETSKRISDILEWLIELFQTGDLPSTTETLFSHSLPPGKEILLLIKCMITQYTLGSCVTAYKLAYFLDQKKMPVDAPTNQSQAQGETLRIVESLLGVFNIKSSSWLFLFEFIMIELQLAGQYSKIISHYQGLLDVKGLDQLRQCIIFTKLGEAYRQTGDAYKALSLYEKSLLWRANCTLQAIHLT